MRIESEALIIDLINRTQAHIGKVKKFQTLSDNELNWRFSLDSWSVLECLEHLNLYGDFYIPEMERRIKNSKEVPELNFKSGILGNYFANSMLPKEKLNKMKTFSDKDPQGSELDKSTIERFLVQQERILNLLEKAREVSLTRTKTGISISNWIKLRLGDTFRVVVYHNERHILQAQRILDNNPDV